MGRLGEDITFGQLRTFVCAARLGSFVQAADRLGISQPAVSDQIATLEKRLGRSLFRRRRGTTPILTPHGNVMLQDAEAILRMSESFIGETPQTVRERVRISIGPLLRDMYLNPIIPKIFENFPNVDIDLLPVSPFPDTIKALEKGELDLVVYSLPTPSFDKKYTTSICDAPVAFVAQPGTQAALERKEMSLNDLQFIIPTRRAPMSERWVKDLLRGLEIAPNSPPRYLDNGEVVLEMARQGKGVAYLMAESILPDIEAGSLEVLDLQLPPMHRVIAQSPYATPVVAFVQSELSKALRAGQCAEAALVRRTASSPSKSPTSERADAPPSAHAPCMATRHLV